MTAGYILHLIDMLVQRDVAPLRTNPSIWRQDVIRIYPRPVLAFGHCRCLYLCLCICVCVSLCKSLVCRHNNSGPVQARIAKIWTRCAKDFGYGPYCSVVRSTLTFKVKYEVKININLILRYKLRDIIASLTTVEVLGHRRVITPA